MKTAETKDFWTDQKITDLKAMWSEGHSASQIAGQIGTTRSAVIGKVHRLKLEKRMVSAPRSNRAATVSVAKPKRVGSPGQKKAFQPKVPYEPMDEDDHLVDVTYLCGLEDLTEQKCKFPIGDPQKPDFGFCGVPKDRDAGPYCEYHTRIATNVRG